MIKQTLTWTALPKASSGPKQAGTELRLSVYVAPRLWNSDASVTSMPLSDFPDWLDWPAQLAQASFEVAFDGGPTLPAVPENVDLRSDLWQALFKPTTTVKPFVFEDLSGARIQSFSAATIHGTIKGVYQRAAIDAGFGSGTDLPGRGVLAADPDLADIARPVEPQPPYEPPEDLDLGPVFVGEKGPPEPEPDPIAGGEEEEPEEGAGDGCNQGCVGCLLWPFRLIQRFFELLGINLFAIPASAEPLAEAPPLEGSREPAVEYGAAAPSRPPVESGEAASEPAAAPVPMAAASAQQEAFEDLHGYAQAHSKVSVPLPTQPEIEDQYDFHQMISSLGDYPNLMRNMGLVVDLVVTLDANLPADTGKVSLVVTPPPGLGGDHATPKTHYDLGEEVFLARPRPGSELSGGLLSLDDSTRFEVVQTDVAGSGLKLQNTATNVRGMELLGTWPANAPEDAGLPALQTAGISVIRSEQVPELRRRIDRSFALNASLAAIDGSPHPAYAGAGAPPPPDDELFADDLVRGYRLDVWDDQSSAWHSLCRRLGNYDFLEGPAGTLTLADLEDEGFVQMAATESRVAESEREIKVHESLFTWDGWSLAAPRPGQSILPDQTTGNADNAAVTQFKLETAFRPRPASLPRLRFGWRYRLRARMVDLAGNSVFDPGDPEFSNTQARVTPEFQFNRFEPVAPPALMLKAEPLEGESLEHLVVRSSIHDATQDIADQESQRHVVPPKTSQHMAERHRVFDGTPDIRTDAAAYDLASREAGSLTERMNLATGTMEQIPGTVKIEDPVKKRTLWLQPNDVFEVAFLPDNFARGVLFMGLPGTVPDAVTAGVNKIAFTGLWPDLEPLRLRMVGLEDGAGPPAAPSWDVANRVLSVQVPQGELFRVRYSTYFEKADLEMMGVWDWVQEAAPPNLAALEDRATEGRNWLHLPFRELELVHAVQQPLAIPVVSQLAIAPAKALGATSVTLDGHTDLDAKSTGKIDLRAAWRDPNDDLAKSAYDAVTDFDDKEMLVAEITAHDRANDQLDTQSVEHPFGDTKYHQVTYTAIGTTRYREYFPAAVQANPQDLIRPTPAEVGTAPADNARFVLDIPNSARPSAVEPLYAVPAFSWSEPQNAGGVIVRERQGGALRLYMNRPWYSSGDGELLGVVLRRPADVPLSDNWMKLRKYASEWGMDPLWRADETAPLVEADFANPVNQGSNLSLAELAGVSVDVVGFEAQYDSDRNLWFSDIALTAATQYFPFVRLALARFQPISVPGAHLSPVVLSDFIQVLPHRTVRYDTTQLAATSEIEITVNGPAYFHRELERFASPLVSARVQRRKFDTGDELGWEDINVTSIPTIQEDVQNTIWKGKLRVPGAVPNPMRVVVTEAETYAIDDPVAWQRVPGRGGDDVPIEGGGSDIGRGKGPGHRIVFADAIEI